ncbi:hypothetical protein SALBM135S_09281 [Streptomyces alboniger]
MTPRARARRRLLTGALLGTVLAPALLTGCAESVDPIERLGRKAAEKVPSRLTEESGKPGAVHRCGQSFRTAERVGAAPTAGREPTGRPSTAETAPEEPRGGENRCPGKAPPSRPRPGSTPKP